MSNPQKKKKKDWKKKQSGGSKPLGQKSLNQLISKIFDMVELISNRMSCLENQSHAIEKSNGQVKQELQTLSEMIRLWSRIAFDKSLAQGIYKDERLFRALEEQAEGIESNREIFLRERRDKTAQAYLEYGKALGFIDSENVIFDSEGIPNELETETKSGDASDSNNGAFS
jgi:hypothetical protein